MFDNIYYFATTEYGGVIPETIRRTEAEAIAALCAFRKCDEAHAFDHGRCLAMVNGFGTVFTAHGEITYIKGFRANRHDACSAASADTVRREVGT
jgi:hypothetical protein